MPSPIACSSESRPPRRRPLGILDPRVGVLVLLVLLGLVLPTVALWAETPDPGTETARSDGATSSATRDETFRTKGAERLGVQPRKILYLYRSSQGETPVENDGYELYGRPLAYLGLDLVYLDVDRQPLPVGEAATPYRGFILAAGELSHSEPMCRWVAEQIRQGRKAFLIDALTPDGAQAPEAPPVSDEVLNEPFGAMGLHVLSQLEVTRDEDLVRVKKKAEDWFGFEAGLGDGECFWYRKVEIVDPRCESILTLWWEEDGRGLASSEADAVVFCPGGAYAVEEYLIKVDVAKDRRYWRVDPIRFFERAFDTAGLPKPDPNVLNGSRVFFAHVDGDGFNSYSQASRGKICGEVLYDELYNDEEFDLPHSVSVISAEVDTRTTYPVKVSVETARKVFALPNVEIGTHTFAHPYDWESGWLAFEGIVLDGRPYRMDYETEIAGSIRTLNALAPSGKQTSILMWSGECNPPEEALRIVERLGIAAINGGDSRYDDVADSLTAIAPPVAKVGSLVRYNTGNANDYIYTNEWIGPFDGFKDVVKTFVKTASPRLLLPVNIYYHFYSGERAESLQALLLVYRWCMRQGLAPVYASDYVRFLRGWLEAEIVAEPDGWWTVRNEKDLRTVRFDDALGSGVDMAGATGVIGFGHVNTALYVYLDDGEEHRFRLVPMDSASARPVDGPVLRKANRFVFALRREADGIVRFETEGPTDGRFWFTGFEADAYYRVENEHLDGHLDGTSVNRSASDGSLGFDAPLTGRHRISIVRTDLAAYRSYLFSQVFHRVLRYLLLFVLVTGGAWFLIRRYARRRRAHGR